MNAFGTKLGTVGIALVSVGTITVASTLQDPPPRPIPAVQLAAESPPAALRISPTVSLTSPNEPSAPTVGVTAALSAGQQVSVVESLLRLDLGRFIVPPSATQPIPPPPTIPAPSPTPAGFDDAIINAYHAIEPWVRWGFELATYAVGWVPWVGWLAPQIMIFYNFGERIVESLVVNTANWLGGSQSFVAGLGNVATDSWNALVQLGIDQWNFWLPSLPPLPPLPLATQETTTSEQDDPVEAVAADDEQRASSALTVGAQRRSSENPELVATEGTSADETAALDDVEVQEKVVAQVGEPAVVEGQTESTLDDPETVKESESAGTPSDPPAGLEPAPVTPAKKKPFAKKPAAVSSPSTPRSEGSTEPSQTEAANTDTKKPPRLKDRANGTRKHRATGSPDNEAAGAPDAT